MPPAAAAGPPQGPPIIESVWIENCAVSAEDLPGGKKALMFTLPTGRRYIFPLDRMGQEAISKLVSPVAVFGPGDLPNGSRG